MHKTTRPRRGADRQPGPRERPQAPPPQGRNGFAGRTPQPYHAGAPRPQIGVVPGGRHVETDANGQPVGPPMERQLKGPSHHWLVDDGRGGTKSRESNAC